MGSSFFFGPPVGPVSPNGRKWRCRWGRGTSTRPLISCHLIEKRFRKEIPSYHTTKENSFFHFFCLPPLTVFIETTSLQPVSSFSFHHKRATKCAKSASQNKKAKKQNGGAIGGGRVNSCKRRKERTWRSARRSEEHTSELQSR